MFPVSKLHQVPQAVIDIASNLNESKGFTQQQTYIGRLEAIRDYINSVLEVIESKNKNAFRK